MIIDFHTHCFKDDLAPKAMQHLASLAQYPYYYDGTVGQLKLSMKNAQIDKSVVLNIATNAKQNYKVNDFAISLLDDDMLVPFGSIHPNLEDYKAEIDRLKAAGIKGLKFHPDYQEYTSDDKVKAYPIYEYAVSCGFIMLFHCGCDLVVRNPLNNTPSRFANILRDFKGAKIVGAHLGGQNLWDEMFKHILGKDVYLDTSFGFKFMTKQQIQHVLDNHDNDKILFASDAPWQKQVVEVAEMREFVSDKALCEKILGQNAAKLLNL